MFLVATRTRLANNACVKGQGLAWWSTRASLANNACAKGKGWPGGFTRASLIHAGSAWIKTEANNKQRYDRHFVHKLGYTVSENVVARDDIKFLVTLEHLHYRCA